MRPHVGRPPMRAAYTPQPTHGAALQQAPSGAYVVSNPPLYSHSTPSPQDPHGANGFCEERRRGWDLNPRPLAGTGSPARPQVPRLGPLGHPGYQRTIHPILKICPKKLAYRLLLNLCTIRREHVEAACDIHCYINGVCALGACASKGLAASLCGLRRGLW